MRSISYTVKDGYTKIKICDYLRGELSYSYRSLTMLRKAMGLVLLNGRAVTVVERAKAGDVITVNIPEDSMKSIPSSIEVKIPYEDDDLLVFDKPPFMPVHEAKRHQEDTLANVFAAHCQKTGQSLIFRAVNRLDRDTSGLIVIAKHRHSAAMLSGGIKKQYLAVVCGEPPENEGTVNAPIKRLAPEHQVRIVSPDGRHAVTHYKVLKRGGGYALLSLTLETGRTHQIRVHMKHIGYPLAGDTLYGGDLKDINRHALHCANIDFVNKITEKHINIHSDLPEDMLKLVDLMNNDE